MHATTTGMAAHPGLPLPAHLPHPADCSVRIALTVGATPTEDGAHAQRIAPATGDWVTAARRFRAAGGRLLPIPADYYDDLAARSEFADGEVET
ncbi:hypothetical protein [Streptomyces sp. NPDC051636]|uniref:hypothetical protein n=1 Tax=Streptomyces sp. NPDC051636 TaxID=3365663 RepID=UPI003789E407